MAADVPELADAEMLRSVAEYLRSRSGIGLDWTSRPHNRTPHPGTNRTPTTTKGGQR